MEPAPQNLSLRSPENSFALTTSLFLRALAVIHAIAFASLWTQLSGLIGPNGILPAAPYLAAVREHLGSSAYLQLPTFAWLFGADTFLHLLCALGLLSAALLFLGIAQFAALLLLWLAYLSLVNVGQLFLGFQWDALLLETTFLSLFLAVPFPWRRGAPTAQASSTAPSSTRTAPSEPSPLARFLLRWLLFRLMFLSGIVKLTSGDTTWRDFTALTFHFETQPLPNPLAYFIHHLPDSVHRATCAGMFFLELVVPFFLFAPRTLRHNAALLLAALQIAIFLTGNYTFFNLLTLALCLLNLDDRFYSSLLRRPAKCHTIYDTSAPSHRRLFRLAALAAAAFVVLFTSIQSLPSLHRALQPPGWFNSLAAHVAPFRTFNNYGLFAVMTTSRPELIIEGSDDRRTWHAYELPYKPGALTRRPPIVAPHQPRLDWQLWFAALGSPDQNRWLLPLCEHLLRGTPEVLALFSHNPFPDRPPRHLRIVRYDYRFTTPAQRTATARWWDRTPVDLYLPPLSLR